MKTDKKVIGIDGKGWEGMGSEGKRWGDERRRDVKGRYGK